MSGKFQFNGDWETKINLNILGEYLLPDYSKQGKVEKYTNYQIHLRIHDKFGDFNPDPEQEQINAINFILDEENQIKIITSIVRYLNAVIYPYYKEHVFDEEEYPEAYPEVSNVEDYQRYFRLEQIQISFHNKDNFAYCSFSFSIQLLDAEHGITIGLHKDRCIDHGAGDDIAGLSEVLIEYDETKRKEFEKYRLELQAQSIFFQPDPKYNQLKPWQHHARRSFGYAAYLTNKDDLIIDSIEEGKANIREFGFVYKMALDDKREKLVKYFESKGFIQNHFMKR